MNIRPVTTPADLQVFMHLPYRLYRHNPVWVPPLRDEVHGQFDPVRNPTLDHTRYSLFLLEDNGQVVGRIAAFMDTLANDYWGEPVGLFGYYECPNDPEASRLLLDTAADWLRAQGMPSCAVRGVSSRRNGDRWWKATNLPRWSCHPTTRLITTTSTPNTA